MNSANATFRNGRIELSEHVDWPEGTAVEVRPLDQKTANGSLSAGDSDWPNNYFESTAGTLAGERFERPDQGELPERDAW